MEDVQEIGAIWRGELVRAITSGRAIALVALFLMAAALRLTVVGYERGGATTAVEERPAIRYSQQVMSIPEARALTRASVGGAAAAPAAR